MVVLVSALGLLLAPGTAAWAASPGQQTPAVPGTVTAPAPGGTVVAWGRSPLAEDGVYEVPAGLTDVVSVATTFTAALAVRRDGTVVGWGRDDEGIARPVAGLSDVVAVSGSGSEAAMALTADGTVALLGDRPPQPTPMPEGFLSGVSAIASGGSASVVLKRDGTVVEWADWPDDRFAMPAGLSGVTAISSGFGHVLALTSTGGSTSGGTTSTRGTPYRPTSRGSWPSRRDTRPASR